MNEEQNIGIEQYWGLPRYDSEWSTKVIAELASMCYEMSDQGEPMYKAYSVGMMAIISDLRMLNTMLLQVIQAHTSLMDLLEVEQIRGIFACPQTSADHHPFNS